MNSIRPPSKLKVPRKQATPSQPHQPKRNSSSSLLQSKLAAFSRLQPTSTAHRTLVQLGILNSKSSETIQQLASHFTGLIKQSLLQPIHSPKTQFTTLTSDLIHSTKSLPPIQSQQELDRILLCNFIPWAAHQSRPRTPQELASQSDTSLHAGFNSLSALTDIRRPQDLYPEARRYKRQIHLHVGPTNSGKTHAGLRALHRAHTGVYAGPLRLLAHEVFSRMNSGQIADDLEPRACNLVTGEEQRITHPTAGLTSCTVEMLSCNQFYDVVVIDEIQMIGDLYRGDAWTQALLGVQAKQVHLCGEESVVGLIERITRLNGDEFFLHRYQRLTPLKVSDKSLNYDLKNIRPGDCVVSFSRNSLYNLKKSIQKSTHLRVGMAYGGLPPEVREREAQLFNLGSQFVGEEGYDVLVGSDAIGMGLNLKIKRVIFESLHKFDGRNEVPLSVSQIKQIGGRAGRYGTKVRRDGKTIVDQTEEGQGIAEEETIGEVLTLKESDMDFLRKAMASPFEPIKKAVLKAPFSTVEGMARRAITPNLRYSHLLELRRGLTLTSPEFRIGDEKNSSQIADVLEPIVHLSRCERDLFSSAPANPRSPMVLKALQLWAGAHSNRTQVGLKEWTRRENVGETIEQVQLFNQTQKVLLAANKKQNINPQHLNESLLRLESIHKSLVLYLWLSFRLPESFVDPELCLDVKQRVEAALGVGLNAI